MENIRLILLKILLLATIIAILSASVAEAKKSKKHYQTIASKEYKDGHIESKKIKRSAYERSWKKPGYGAYNLPPYLVYNRKLGAYYPYFKYPDNTIRRNMRKIARQYSTTNKYSTLPQRLGKRNVRAP